MILTVKCRVQIMKILNLKFLSLLRQFQDIFMIVKSMRNNYQYHSVGCVFGVTKIDVIAQ